MTEVIFSHYQLTWKVDGFIKAANFWLPGNAELSDKLTSSELGANEALLNVYVGDMLNSVELNSDAFDWSLEKIETRVYRMVG